MYIYYHIDEFNRDSIVASSLAKLFKRRGHILIYGNRITNRIIPFFKHTFDIIILPRPHFFYDNWGENWLKWDCKFVTLPTENVGVYVLNKKVMSKTILEREYFEGKERYINRIDCLTVWGELQKKLLEQTVSKNVSSKVKVIGHPRHDKNCLINKKKNNKKIKIAILTRSVAFNNYNSIVPLERYKAYFEKHSIYEYYKDNRDNLKSKRVEANPSEVLAILSIDNKIIIDIIKELSTLKDLEIFLRPHPKENLNVWDDIFSKMNLKNVTISDNSEPLTHFLSGFDYAIGPPSTSFYDAMMLGVKPISISNLDSRRHLFVKEYFEDNNLLMSYVFKPKSIPEMLNIIFEKTKIDKNYKDTLKKEANFPDCSESLTKFVELCLKIITKRKSLKIIQIFNLYLFKIALQIFNFIYLIKLKIDGKKMSSSNFLMTTRIIRKINLLGRQ